MKVNLIFSSTNGGIIGQNMLPDKNHNLFIESKKDLHWFKKNTVNQDESKENILIMGYNTWKTLPKNGLPKRKMIVLSKNHIDDIQSNGIICYSSLEEIIDWCETNNNGAEIFVIGGASLYDLFWTDYNHMIDKIYITKFINYPLYNSSSYDTDLVKINTEILNLNDNYKIIYDEDFNDDKCKMFDVELACYCEMAVYSGKFMIYEKINKEEQNYLDILDKILKEGIRTETRNGNTLSLFGEKMVFNMDNGFPLLTTKKMPWKTILRELLWFLSGSTDNKKLNEKNVHIWDGNATKEYMEQRGLDYKEGDLGPIYGFQWKYFGAEYKTCDDNYDGKGINQIEYIINEITNNPSSRRIIMSAWNPPDLDKMALPPCHVMCQFYVNQIEKTLDCQLYQRSGDMFLGVPFNIASYSFLLYIISNITGYKPGKLIHILGDCHIYENHIDQVKEQIQRKTFKFPKLFMEPLINIGFIDESLFNVKDYKSHPSIKGTMSA
jgi:thymidylate synthase